MQQYRTHTCSELRKTDIDKNVYLAGWIHSRRDHGGVLFIDLRDNYGLTQVVVYPTVAFLDEVSRLPKETVIRFGGKVAFRSEENVNPKLPTGEIEVVADSFEVLGTCDALPLNVFPEDDAPKTCGSRTGSSTFAGVNCIRTSCCGVTLSPACGEECGTWDSRNSRRPSLPVPHRKARAITWCLLASIRENSTRCRRRRSSSSSCS